MSYTPFIYKLNNNYNIELSSDTILTNRINKPKASLGFNTFFRAILKMTHENVWGCVFVLGVEEIYC